MTYKFKDPKLAALVRAEQRRGAKVAAPKPRNVRKAKAKSAKRIKLVAINSGDKAWTRKRWILWFGATGSTYLLVWANSLDDALDECVDWIADRAKGLLADSEVNDEYNRLVAEGIDEEEAQQQAEVDTTQAGNEGHYLHSREWGIYAENPSREQVLALQSGG
jgi:hypothetical protein